MRERNRENKGLPARWRLYHGAYYFRVPVGEEGKWDGKKQFRLGKTLPEAYAVWAKRMEIQEQAETVAELLDKYALRVVPTKAVKTRVDNARAIKRLRAVLGDVSISEVRPKLIYQYVEHRKTKRVDESGRVQGGGTAAHREIEVLSHAFTKAVEWGIIDRHPFKGEIRLAGEKPRTRYVEDWEIIECLGLSSQREKGSVRLIQAYIRLKLLTGLRQGDLLRLRLDDLREDGIHVEPRKTAHTTGKKLIFVWTPERRAAVDACLEVRQVHISASPWLFCTRRGECYFKESRGEARGWKAMWQRFMKRVLAETAVRDPFTEHDLRAKAGSDAESLERARQLLGHADAAITQRVYRRRPERIE